jgi:hypothetical protein
MASDAEDRLRKTGRERQPGDDGAVRLLIVDLPISAIDSTVYRFYRSQMDEVTLLHLPRGRPDPTHAITLLRMSARQLNCGSKKCTPLHIAVLSRNMEVVKVLLDNMNVDEGR